MTPFGGPQLNGAVWVNTRTSHAGGGDVNLYTCPAGKRCFMFATWCGNPTESQITVQNEVKVIGSNRYWVTNTGGVLTYGTTYHRSAAFVLEAGEIAAVHTSAPGLNCVASTLNYDSSSPLFTPRRVVWESGDNTIYTCCTAGHSSAVQIAQGVGVNGISGDETFNYQNLSGSPAKMVLDFVPKGVSPGAGTHMAAAVVPSGPNLYAPMMQAAFGPGDSVSVHTNQSGAQIGWLTIMEY